MIRTVRDEDAKQICSIYNYYIENTIYTFEEEPVSSAEMKKRIGGIAGSLPWYVWEEEGQVLGFTYASKWKERSAYHFSVESSIYLQNGVLGKGLGVKLYAHLLAELKRQGKHAVIAGIALPNERSCRLHERLGFINVGQLSQVGCKLNRWIDVAYWELLLKG